MQPHSIALLTCWYGPYPWYFPYFIHSCRYNPTIDFIIITDNIEPIHNKTNNVKIIYKTLDEIKSGFSENKIKKALDDWYQPENKNYEEFAKKYPVEQN